VILYVMLCGAPPFDGDDKQQVFDKIMNKPVQFDPKDWADVGEDAKELITLMLNKDPRKRVTIQNTLQHPWLRSNRRQSMPRRTRLMSAVGHLRSYKAPNRLKAEAMPILLKYLTDDQVSDLRLIFLELDKQNSGYITADDLRKALADLGVASAAEEIDGIV
jgi:calcium-dependent protein kinase